MCIYLALAICRTYHEFTETGKGQVEKGLRAACQTLTYGPMLCVLFIACRMRVEFLSDGKDQPQIWVQKCMYSLTFSVLISTLLVLLMPIVGTPVTLKEGTPDLEKPAPPAEGESKVVFYVLTTLRYLILLGLYGGLAGVIVGINVYMPPGHKDLATLPKPAPAVACTMILAVFFFAIQLVIAFCRTYTELSPETEFPKTKKTFEEAVAAVEFAPMLAILFLAARMRALQHDGQPQKWAQDAMYASTYAMCTTTLLAIGVPSVLDGKVKKNEKTGEVTIEVENANLGKILAVVRFICMIGFYGGAITVMYSIFVFEAPAGPEHTIPVSPAVQCVVNLTCQFFFVYFMMTLMLTVSEFSEMKLEDHKVFAAIEAAKSTLGFAPMLAILFVTTRMYALLITDKKGAPQAWVQDGFYMCTWSLFISFLMCLITGLAMGEVDRDEDGNVKNKFENKYVAIGATVIRYLSMLLLYGGICSVIVGLFSMTPENANGRGSLPLVSDAVRATPVGAPPPGPNDVAGAAGQMTGF
jgi:hypothetical protein